jgi:hypothetical protein
MLIFGTFVALLLLSIAVGVYRCRIERTADDVAFGRTKHRRAANTRS